jgi:hypothetical protein
MIPPLPQIRLRSIQTWLQSNPETSNLSSEALRKRAQETDEQMMQEFSDREDRKMEALMAAKRWGTEDGLREFLTFRLELWNEIVSETLPAITEPPSEA